MPTHAKTGTMNAPLRKSWTQEEFFSWAERQETRYEFDGFEPVAMTGGTNVHSEIGVNLLSSLKSRLKDGRCKPLGSDAGVATVGTTIRYPDALVTCTRYDSRARTVPGVVVIFEVLSPTSGFIDHVVKVREYAEVPSIHRYVILESTAIGLQVLERSSPDQPWQTTALTSGDTLRIPEIGIEIPVAEIYEGVEFTDQDNQDS
jgi:Uma2 family endonuclease